MLFGGARIRSRPGIRAPGGLPGVATVGTVAGGAGCSHDQEGIESLSIGEIVREIEVAGAPYGVTIGPDGALWFTLVTQSAIGRYAEGQVETFALDPVGGQPTVIVAGDDNALWFTEFHGGRLGRITLDGAVSSLTMDGPYGVCAGPGGMWFTELQAGRVGRIAGDGEIEGVAVDGMPSMITAGSDGAVWFTVNQGNAIGRIDTDLTVTLHSLPTPSAAPVGIAAGPDGAVWFTEIGVGAIGRIDSAGTVTEYALPDRDSRPHAIVTGPDGALWFTEWASGNLGRIDTDGKIDHLTLPGAEPHGLTVDSTGHLWVAMESGALVEVSPG